MEILMDVLGTTGWTSGVSMTSRMVLFVRVGSVFEKISDKLICKWSLFPVSYSTAYKVVEIYEKLLNIKRCECKHTGEKAY